MLAFFAWPRGGGERNADSASPETLNGNRKLEHVEFEKQVPEGGKELLVPGPEKSDF